MPEHLFSPLRLGKVSIPNRICFLAHRTNFADQGLLTDRHLAYYRRRAEGGCGLIVVGELSIHPNDRPWAAMIDAYDRRVIPGYRRLTEAIHRERAFVFANLNHHGFQSSGAITRHEVWGPSALSDIAFGETSKAMEAEDREVVIQAFSEAASIAREGGFDGIEIDMGPESLLRQYLSPLSNRRPDEYGGSLENRMRFPLEVLDRVKKTVGDDFTVGIRLCADEKFWGAITIEDSEISAKAFESADCADFVDVSLGTYYNLYLTLASMHTPIGFTVDLAERIKRSIQVPVIASYQIGPSQMARKVIAEGRADAVGYVRQLVCDPDFPKKAQRGREGTIRYCVKDNRGCIGRVNQNKVIGCIQNPEVGYERDLQARGPVKTNSVKKVIVVGAGPAGLEAARTARVRGHSVAVYEKEKDLGGQINLIRIRPGRQGMFEIIRYLRQSLEELGVTVSTAFEVTSEWVLQQNPDAVVLATGSKPIGKPVPGAYGPPVVLNVWEVLSGQYPVGERVLFVDENGGHHAAATVEWLADQGKKVDMVTSDLFIGIELAPLGDLYLTRQRLLQKGVTFRTDVIVDELDGKRVRARDIYTNKRIEFHEQDTVVLDMGNVAEDALYRQIKGRIKEVYRVGDCVAPRGIDMAILEGRRVGERL
jgi:mycofactocin system FadH/OYE family oxidoreductase 2